MQLRQENGQRQVQAQKLAPHLIQANTLLQCSNLELMQMIAQEQQENPALDSPEEEFAGSSLCSCGGLGSCAACRYGRGDGAEERFQADDRAPSEAEAHAILAGRGEDTAADERMALRGENELSRIESDGGLVARESGDSDFDPLMMARVQMTLEEHLLSHLRATSQSPVESHIAEYLVHSLDERGWLQVDVDEACAVLRVPCALIMAGIERLQACDPPGVGGRDLRECLLLQMRHRREQGGEEDYDALTERLITDHWNALIKQQHTPLARRLGVSPGRLNAALAFIQRLSPYPAAQFRQPWDHRPDTQSVAIRPDVVIRRTASGFAVDVLGFENISLQINPHYRGLYETIREARAGGTTPRSGKTALTPDHERHVVAYVERATLFLKNLQQRRRTIQKIAQALIECQQGFLETGQRAFLRPLTRTKLALQVGMHESTISRALLHKYVQLPSQEVVSFDIFFENAVTVKDAVAAMIAEESPDSPLSDQAIAAVLAERGFDVARRTVVKYREELRIPASYLRRRR